MNSYDVLVSIIIPTHNRYECLFRAINSAYNQTYKNIEILVIDDNYENKTLREKITSRVNELPFEINYILPEKHLGSANTRNLGIELSRGEYIAFLDDDDVYYPNKIEKQLKCYFESGNNTLGLVYCFGKIIYPNGSIELELTDKTGICIADHMKNNIAGTSFWMCPKEALLNVGGFETAGAHDDGIVILKLMVNGYSVDLVKEFLVDYYVHNYDEGITGITYTTLEADKRYFLFCKDYFSLITEKDKKSVVNHYYDDRNWNLIILGDAKKCISDLRLMKEVGVTHFTRGKCIMRYIFRNFVIFKENQRLKKRGLKH